MILTLIISTLSGMVCGWAILRRHGNRVAQIARTLPEPLEWRDLEAQRVESVERAVRQAELTKDFEEFDKQLSREHYLELHPEQLRADDPWPYLHAKLGERVISNEPGRIIQVAADQRNARMQYLASMANQGLLGPNAAAGLQQLNLSDEERARVAAMMQQAQPGPMGLPPTGIRGTGSWWQ